MSTFLIWEEKRSVEGNHQRVASVLGQCNERKTFTCGEKQIRSLHALSLFHFCSIKSSIDWRYGQIQSVSSTCWSFLFLHIEKTELRQRQTELSRLKFLKSILYCKKKTHCSKANMTAEAEATEIIITHTSKDLVMWSHWKQPSKTTVNPHNHN